MPWDFRSIELGNTPRDVSMILSSTLGKRVNRLVSTASKYRTGGCRAERFLVTRPSVRMKQSLARNKLMSLTAFPCPKLNCN